MLEGGHWKIATMHYFPEYEGDYNTGWSNVGGKELPIIPYHFTIDESGIPIPPAQGPAPASGTTTWTAETSSARINAKCPNSTITGKSTP